MTTGKTTATAGLVFTAFCDIDIVAVTNRIVAASEALGHHVTQSHILSDLTARVATDQLEMEIEVQEDVGLDTLAVPAAIFLSLVISPRENSRVSRFARDSVLARTLQTLHDLLQPDFVKWVDAEVLLSAEDFARAVGLKPRPAAKRPRTRPRRLTRLRRLPGIDETNEMLQQRIAGHDPAIFGNASSPDRLRRMFAGGWIDPDVLAAEAAAQAQAREQEDIEKAAPLRLSAWLLSFAVTLFALPVGIMLLVLNLAKGENLRLASQTAALTGTFIAFQSFGTMAHAMSALQVVIG